MLTENTTRVKAVHPNWTGYLKLSNIDDRMLHESHGSTGRYELEGSRLKIFWDDYPSESFFAFKNIYLHEKFLESAPPLEYLLNVSINGKSIQASSISLIVPESNYSVNVRLLTSDQFAFDQVFLLNDYQSANLPDQAETIIDLGANVGFASVFFGLKYPTAKILALEPEPSNYAAMLGNVAALGARVQTLLGAVWTCDGWLNLHTEAPDGASLGAWGVQVSETVAHTSGKTQCYRMDTLLENAGFETVDILKIDIEGAELELFSSPPHTWLSKVHLLIVETHDRFRPGSEDAVREALAANFEELPRNGENLFFRHRT